MQLGAMRERVYARTGLADTDGIATPERVNAAINDALAFVAAEADWPWLQTTASIVTTASDGTYALPANYLRTRALIHSDGEPIEFFSVGELDDRWDSTGTGRPEAFAVDGEEIVLRPIPDSVMTITHRYIRAEKVLNADSESPLLPEPFQPAALDYACYLVLSEVRADERAQAALARYTQWQSRLLDQRRRVSGPRRPRVRPGGAF